MQPPPQNLEAIREAIQELYEPSIDSFATHNSISHIHRQYRERILTQGGIKFLNSLHSLEKMGSLPWSMWKDSQCSVGNWPTLKISPISNSDYFLNSLRGAAFNWYATLQRIYIMSC